MSGVSGILLAGGASKRFGRPKVIEPVDGAPLFHRPLRALLECCDEVIVVVAPSAPDLPLPAGGSRVRFVRDDVAYEGPLAGASTGLREASREYAALAAADMPGLRPELLALMARTALARKESAVVLADADGARPLPAILATKPALSLAAHLLARGERRLRALVDGLHAHALPEAVWSAADLRGAWRQDVNLPEDLANRPR